MANHLSFDVLSQLVQARASTDWEPRARRHLASCARCRSELEWLRRIHDLPGRGELGGASREVLGAECGAP